MFWPHFALAIGYFRIYAIPSVNIFIPLVLCYLPDILSSFVGMATVTDEYPYGQSIDNYFWVTHGLSMNLIICAIVFAVSYYVCTKQNMRTSLFVAGAFLSHWTLDAICMPWTSHSCPKLPLFFSSQPDQDIIGLYLYYNVTVSNICEFLGLLALIVALVFYFKDHWRKDSRNTAEERVPLAPIV
eukprot:gnl/Dysnectes_brevis/2870_a3507_1183.p1 GENE.gnl/Dysnectes_brevis/2870_a3507_1183~~gnl/Dysnectes_brevis/2870_a3507_1183.p1  ORF type:complete len:185 (-),score=24.70 gnl/Dysnectes_brevis/2870_a3507_1183:73-627(-)